MWVKLGSALRAGARTLGVVCDSPDEYGNVKLLLEDGSTTEFITPAALTQPSGAELAASPWLTQVVGEDTGWVERGSALRMGARALGVVCSDPDEDGEVKLLLEDGSMTGYIRAAMLAKPSEAELSEAPWAVGLLTDEDMEKVKKGTQLRRTYRVGAATADPADGKVRLAWPDGSVSDWLSLVACGRPFAHKLLPVIEAEHWDAVAETATRLACEEADAKGDHALHHLLRNAPDGVSKSLENAADEGRVPRGPLRELFKWLGWAEAAVEKGMLIMEQIFEVESVGGLIALDDGDLGNLVHALGLEPQAGKELRAAVAGLDGKPAEDMQQVAKWYFNGERPVLRDRSRRDHESRYGSASSWQGDQWIGVLISERDTADKRACRAMQQRLIRGGSTKLH